MAGSIEFENRGVVNKRIFHGWFIVAACFLCMLISGGIGWFTFPVFLKPLENEFGWTRTQTMFGVGIWALVSGAFSPILGYWIDRFGARRIVLAGVVSGGLCMFGFAEIRSISHFYVFMVVAALTTAASTYVPVASLISQWFDRKRGVAMSIAMMGTGVGGFIMPNVSNLLIETMDWRWAYRIFGLTVWLLLPPVALWVRGRPSDMGLEPDGGEADRGEQDVSISTESAEGFSARQALGTINFWGIGIADLAAAIGVVAIETQVVAFSIESGIRDAVAAFAYSLIRAMMVVGMIAVGLAADRFNRRLLITLSYGLPGIVVFLLIGLKSAVPLFCFAIFYGMLSAGRSAIWPLVVNDCFGKRAFATVMGFLMIFSTVGSGIGPTVAGYLYDKSGNYNQVFLMAIAAFAVAGISMAIGAKSRSRDTTE